MKTIGENVGYQRTKHPLETFEREHPVRSEDFTSVRPIPSDETLKRYAKSPAKVGFDLTKSGDTTTFAWSWVGDVALIHDTYLPRIESMEKMGVLPWGVRLLGYDHSKKSWYMERVIDGS